MYTLFLLFSFFKELCLINFVHNNEWIKAVFLSSCLIDWGTRCFSTFNILIIVICHWYWMKIGWTFHAKYLNRQMEGSWLKQIEWSTHNFFQVWLRICFGRKFFAICQKLTLFHVRSMNQFIHVFFIFMSAHKCPPPPLIENFFPLIQRRVADRTRS